jgi:hypothetical protein
MKNLLKLIQDGWRDIATFLVIGICLSVAVEYLISLTTVMEVTGAGSFIALLQGFTKFAGANLCAWFFGVNIAFPFMSQWGRFNFNDTWGKLSDEAKIKCFLIMAVGELLMSAICFA